MARGPKPQHQPSFDATTLVLCRFLVRQRVVPFAHRQRAQMVLLLHEDPTLSSPEIARRVGCHPNTVRHWRRVWSTGKFRLGEAPRSGRPATFTPVQVTHIKAVACELPAQHHCPLSRFSLSEIAAVVIQDKIVPAISPATIARFLQDDALRPWRFHSWITPCDPSFLEKAEPVLDLYQGWWEGQPLGPKEFVLSADEKTSIQARNRLADTLPPQPGGRPMLVEHEYERMGALVMLSAWDVQRGHAISVYADSNGKDAFHTLVQTVMTQEPYASATRVHWIVDNGSAHHPSTFGPWLKQAYPNAVAHHLPTYASWLNQVEIFFSIVQRKVLTPNDFEDLKALQTRLEQFHTHYNRTAQPFRWKFTRQQLKQRLHLP
jgi:transposase-like protein